MRIRFELYNTRISLFPMSAGAHTSGEFLDADGDTADGYTADSSPNSFGQSYRSYVPWRLVRGTTRP